LSNRTTFTLSFWIKKSLNGVLQYIGLSSSTRTDGIVAPRNLMRFNADDTLTLGYNPTGSSWKWFITNQVFRDTSSWMHIVSATDTNNSTATDRVKIYINGTRILQSDYGTYDTISGNTTINTANPHALFAYTNSNYADNFQGYAANIQFIDGQALDASYFGETKQDIWIPKAYTGSYGTNGFHLDFADSSNIGNDVSGNNNDWTVN
jgi:hypothetical protein